MRIQVRVKLRLQKSVNKLLIKYNTFEKVTWDQYLATSIAVHSLNKDQAYEYIDQITGNGSLNNHFKKIFDTLENLSTVEKEKVLDSNLFPVLKMDDSNHYEYYPELDVSILNGELFSGDIKNASSIHQILMTDPKGKFHSSSVSSGEIKEIDNVYNITINDDSITLEIIKNKGIPISKDVFTKHVMIDLRNIDFYEGNIYENPNGDSWSIVTNSLISNLSTAVSSFYRNGDFYMITNYGLKKIQLGSIFGIYIYNEKIYEYSKNNIDLCNNVLTELINTGSINTFKTKPLVQILKVVSNDNAQEAINYVLQRKNSAEIAQIGLELLSKGYEQNWNDGSIVNFRKFVVNDSDLVNLYRITPQLEYTIEELVRISSIDKTLLSSNHNDIINEHYTKEQQIRNNCAQILGLIDMSATRERSKILPNTLLVQKYRKLINKLIAHNQQDMSKLTGQKLLNYEEQVFELKQFHDQIENELKKLVND